MKLIALTLLSGAALAGCGTLPAPSAAAEPAAAPSPAVAATDSSNVDAMRMALIDHVARRRGVQVVWVNPPRRAVAGG